MYAAIYGAVNVAVGLISCFYIFMKALNHSAPRKHKMASVLWCLLLGFLFPLILPTIPYTLIIVIYCAASILLILVLTKIKVDMVISAFMLSYGVSQILSNISALVIGLIFMPFAGGDPLAGTTIDHNTPFYMLLYSLISFFLLFLSFLLFRINRFKNGFPFLLKKYAVIVTLIFSGFMLSAITIFRIIDASEDVSSVPLFLIGVFVVSAGIYIWIKRGIRMFYLKKQEAHAIEILGRELAEARDDNRRLTEQNNTLRVADHNTRNRLAALERAVLLMSGGSTETGEELAITLENIKRVSQDYQNDIGRLEGKNTLPSTKIKMLDDLFSTFSSRFMASKDEFKLNVNGSIPYMVENIIEQGKLETMIGDHLQNALIAVNTGNNTFRGVWAIIGLTGDCYEFSVYDSGIPFEVDTLVRLGIERATTYAENGGSGVGFMSTFETMRECNASLVIREKLPSSSDYTKSVTIRFDGKGQYIIDTYRSGEYPLSDRLIIMDTIKAQ